MTARQLQLLYLDSRWSIMLQITKTKRVEKRCSKIMCGVQGRWERQSRNSKARYRPTCATTFIGGTGHGDSTTLTVADGEKKDIFFFFFSSNFQLPRHFKLNEHGVLFAPQETNKYHCYHDSKWMVWMPSYPQNRQRHWQLWTEKMVSRTKLFILSFNNCQNFCSSAGLNSMFLTPGFVERPVLMWDDVPRTLNWLATLQISLIKASTTEMVWIFWARIDF